MNPIDNQRVITVDVCNVMHDSRYVKTYYIRTNPNAKGVQANALRAYIGIQVYQATARMNARDSLSICYVCI